MSIRKWSGTPQVTAQTMAGNTIVAVKFRAQLFTSGTFQDGAVCH